MLQQANEAKAAGTQAFKGGDLFAANLYYLKAVGDAQSIPLESMSEDQQNQVKELVLSCHLNRASCCLRLKKYQTAIEECDKVLQLDPNNVKGLFRRGQARNQLWQLLSAKDDLYTAAKLMPSNKEIRAEIEMWKKRLEEDKKGKSAPGHSDSLAHKVEQLENCGLTALLAGETKHAARLFEKQLREAQRLGYPHSEACAVGNLALARLQLGDVARAKEDLEEALRQLRCLSDKRGEMCVLGNLGVLLMDIGYTEQAERELSKALQLAEDLSEHRMQVGMRSNLGLLDLQRGKVAAALEAFGRSLMAALDAGDVQGQSTCLTNMGVTHEREGSTWKAIEHFEQALNISEQSQWHHGIETDMGNLGCLSFSMGRMDKAAESLQRALLLAETLGHTHGEAAHLCNMGLLELQTVQGSPEKALSLLKKAVAIDKGLRCKSAHSTDLGALGTAHMKAGQLVEAEQSFQKALAVARELGDEGLQVKHCHNLGLALLAQQRPAEALKQLTIALEMARKGKRSGGQGMEVAVLNSLGVVQLELGHVQDAITTLTAAASQSNSSEGGTGEGFGEVYTNLGIAHIQNDCHEEACKYLQLAVDTSKASSDTTAHQPMDQARNLFLLAVAKQHTQAPLEAIQHLEEALQTALGSLSPEVPEVPEVAELVQDGHKLRIAGSFDEALATLFKAWDVLEDRGGLESGMASM